ncbi:unnamed protein product [Cuscuta epithymum]|uniref:Homeobox domain-containing protein n=1 Tax=Cuscuta epithymum TaxID=186058 RepID=A0AAV0DGV8_9ASTE|nr:unnamed protein product [Cuscuta epithymum]
MAEGFGAYHVPQQTRRDKLRALAQNHHPSDGLAPLYYPPPDFLTCAALQRHQQLGVVSDHFKNDKGATFDTGPANFHAPSLYMDPQLHINQEMGRNPFLYAAQNLRVFDGDSFHGGGGGGGDVSVVYKRPAPEALSAGGHGGGGSGQGLSLTLSSSHHHHQNQRGNQSSSSSLRPLELNLQGYDSTMQTLVSSIHGGGGDSDLSRATAPASGGPFTGYASILKGSRFLRPAQQLLEEVCDVVRGSTVFADDEAAESALLDHHQHPPPLPCLQQVDDSQSCNDGVGELRRKSSRLVSMLDEVCRRYKQYYQQLQAVVASFESVAGLNSAAPFANFALKAMSKHFRCLKEAITEQLHCADKSQGHMNYGVEAPPSVENMGKRFYFQSPTIRTTGLMEHPPVWRPQRGLPERAVTVLRAWLFDHFLHPYPTDTDKLMLAKQTGLSRNQVSNWFINARVRLWKPMVEEIHTLETRQAQKDSQKKEQNNNNQSEHSSVRNNSVATTCEDHQLPSKRMREEEENHNSLQGSDQEVAMDLSSYGNMSHHSRLGIGPTTTRGVSLTLGLHQNNELGPSTDSSFPVNAAQRFGLDIASTEGFVLSGFDAHNTQFGRDMIG